MGQRHVPPGLYAPLVAGLVLWIDAQGAGRWLYDHGLALFTSADTAQDVAAAVDHPL